MEFINLKDGRVLEIKSSILDQNSFQLVHSVAQSGFFFTIQSQQPGLSLHDEKQWNLHTSLGQESSCLLI